MPWIAVDADLEDDPRVHALMARRHWSADRCLAFLFRLLRTIRRQERPDGDVTVWTDAYIGSMTRVARPSGLLADLVAVGLVDEADGRRTWRGWMRTNGDFLRRNATSEARAAGGRKGGATRAATAERDTAGRYTRSVDKSLEQSGPDSNQARHSEPEQEPEQEPAAASPPSLRSGGDLARYARLDCEEENDATSEPSASPSGRNPWLPLVLAHGWEPAPASPPRSDAPLPGGRP